jgi:hypothetical protein
MRMIISGMNRYRIVFVPASLLAKAILGYWCLVSNILHSCFTFMKDVPFVQEAGGTPGLVWMCVENVAPTRIHTPYFPSCSRSLYQLCFCRPCLWKIYCFYIFLCIQKLNHCFMINLDHIPREPMAAE